MNSPNGFSMIRTAAVLGTLALFAAARARSDGAEVWSGLVSGPEALREELWHAQFVAPPSEEALAYDAGAFLFFPDGSDPDAGVFAAGLLSVEGADGKVIWPVTVFEDAVTRETVFLNAAGDEVLRQPPPPDYSPGWILDLLYRDGDVPADVASAYDPARVVMDVRLHSPDKSTKWDKVNDPSRAALRNEGAESVRVCAGSSAGRDAGPVAPESGVMSPVSPCAKGAEKGAARSGFKTWYVDSDIGDDANDGLSPDVRGKKRGPKASVQQAIDAAESGDVIEVSGRAPFRDSELRPKAKHIRLRANGNVRF